MASYTFNFSTNCTGTYTVSSTTTAFTNVAFISFAAADEHVVINAIPVSANFTVWNRSMYLPETPLAGQDEFNIVFANNSVDPQEVNTDDQFIMINIPCTSNVEFVDNVAQTGVYNIVWNFGDGTSASGTSVTHTYARPGQYVITKTITFCTEP